MRKTGLRRANQRTGKILLLLAIACGVAGVYVVLQPASQQPLLMLATRVPGAISLPPPWTAWITSQEFITSSFASAGSKPPTVTQYRINTETGKRTAVPSLDGLVARMMQASSKKYPQILPSSDGRHILMHTLEDPYFARVPPPGRAPVPANKTALLSLVDGSSVKSIVLTGATGQVAWMPDGQHWVEVIPGTKGANDTLIVYALNGTSRSLVLPAFNLPKMTVRAKLLGGTKEGHVLFCTIDQPRFHGQGVHFYDVALTERGAKVRTYIVADPPKGRDYENVSLSAQGDRLAWQQYAWDYSALSNLIGHQSRTSSIWTSRLDGTEMREVGHLVTDLSHTGPYGVQWAPDGKRLSFYFDTVLYTIPVE